MKKKIILVTIFLLISAYEFWNYSTHADYRATLRGVTCYGKPLGIKRTACCHGQCESITDWPTKEEPPWKCLQNWKDGVE